MKWKIYSWMPWIKLVVVAACIVFYLFLVFGDMAENGMIRNQLLFALLFCLVIPAGLEQISRIIDTQAGTGPYRDEREQQLKLEASALAFRYAKICCVLLLGLSAALNYFWPNLLFNGAMLGLGIFLMILYAMEMVLYFYCERTK